MGGNPAADMNPNRRNFPCTGPNARSPCFPTRSNTEPVKRIDDHLLDGPDVSMDIALPFSQIENRITDNLPRPMISNIASAVGFKKRNPRSRQKLRFRKDVLAIPVPPHSDDMGMLDYQQLIGNRPALPQFNKCALPFPSLSPRHKSQVANLAHPGLKTGLRKPGD